MTILVKDKNSANIFSMVVIFLQCKLQPFSGERVENYKDCLAGQPNCIFDYVIMPSCLCSIDCVSMLK